MYVTAVFVVFRINHYLIIFKIVKCLKKIKYSEKKKIGFNNSLYKVKDTGLVRICCLSALDNDCHMMKHRFSKSSKVFQSMTDQTLATNCNK